MKRILIVEDEPSVRKPLKDYLEREGFQVLEAGTLLEADSQIQLRPDLILLDWMLPDGQGIEGLKKWRRENFTMPILMVTARADTIDKVLGLELGADDFITKPFEPRELVARIRARLRSETPSTLEKPKGLAIGGFTLDPVNREGTFNGKKIDLTKTEFDLLKLFLENPNQVFSREELLKNVWGYDQYPTTRTVDTHVMQLRQKSHHELFETVHGIGYRFRTKK